MEIYIDEAGNFARPPYRRRAISCVGALVIPSSEARNLLDRFRCLRDKWGLGEVKGRDLSETQIASAISLCRRYDVLLEIRAIDVCEQTPAEIESFQREQGARLEAHITSSHEASIRAEVAARRKLLESLSPQLFVQAVLLVRLFDDVLRQALPYYSLRRPPELGSYRWRVDAKDVVESRFEQLWGALLLPMLQVLSLRSPHWQPTEGDFSHTDQFEAKEPVPEYVKNVARAEGLPIPEEEGRLDLEKLVRSDFELADSRDELGLQLLDVLLAAVRRGMMGTLKRKGWKNVGRLMLSLPEISLLELPGAGRADLSIIDSNVKAVLGEIDRRIKAFVPSRFKLFGGRRINLKRARPA